MTLIAALLGAILLVLVGGGMFLYRVLVVIAKLLAQFKGKLPSSPLLRTLRSF
jgi:hypothetical protein